MAIKRRRNSEQEECITLNHHEINKTNYTNYIICDVAPCVQYKISIDLYNDHVEKMHTYTCEGCQANFPNEYALNLHIDESHNPFVKKPLDFKCWSKECGFLCKSQKEREKHLLNVHGNEFISFLHH